MPKPGEPFFPELAPKLAKWISEQKHSPWIFLYGDLGAGKTTLARELFKTLGFDAAQVQSPTFLKVLTYKSTLNESAIHIDAYRVEEPREFLRFGLENIETFKVAVVEWPDTFEKFLIDHPAFREAIDLTKVLCVRLPPDHDAAKIQISEKLFD